MMAPTEDCCIREGLIHQSAWKGYSANFADAEECYKRTLSLPNVWLKHGVRGGPYEESGRIGVRVAGRRHGSAGSVAQPVLERRNGEVQVRRAGRGRRPPVRTDDLRGLRGRLAFD